MSSNTTLTMIAYVLDIQHDLHQHILDQLSDHLPAKELFFNERLYSKVYDRYQNESNVDLENESKAVTSAQLIEFIDLGDAIEILNKHRSRIPPSLGDYLRSMTSDLETLVPIRNRLMHGRPLRPGDWANLTDKVNKFITRDSFWPHLCQCIDRIDKDPSFILNLPIPSETNDDSKVEHNLPPCDFEETGFLGRNQELDAIKSHLLGPWPVITIIGEGGLGKTAIALKVAYDLLDDDDCPFEHIVWTTCKTAQLTAQGIKNIDGAISDSLGMLKSAGESLFGSSDAVTKDILEYMEEFKILLIIDNLETVLDARIVEFLKAYRGKNSKFLITSRVALGELEYPEKIGPFDDQAAVDLLRKFARVRQVSDIVKANNKSLSNYCRRMKNNPLWIKWFVELVQSGKRAEDALANTSEFMEFAFENVYGNLSEAGREILDVLVTVPGENGQAELAFLTNQDLHTLEAALTELLKTSMLRRNTKVQQENYETTYEVLETSRKYLIKVKPISADRQQEIMQRNRQMLGAIETNTKESNSNPFSMRSVRTRSRSDAVIAAEVRHAFNNGLKANRDFQKVNDKHSHLSASELERLQKRGEDLLRSAVESIGKCARIAPGYFEVYRVEAYLHWVERNLNGARDSYEKAVELEPNWAPLRSFYGGFLMRYLQDHNSARTQFEEANRLSPDDPNVLTDLATLDIQEGNYLEAQNGLEKVLDSIVAPEYIKRKAWTVYIDSFGRSAEDLSRNSNYTDAIECLRKMQQSFSRCPDQFVDKRLIFILSKKHQTIDHLIRSVYDESQIVSLKNIQNWISELEKEIKKTGSAKYDSSNRIHDEQLGGADQKYTGIIKNIDREKCFGFITLSESNSQPRDIFFHRSDFKKFADWHECAINDLVSFSIKSVKKGCQAFDIQLQKK